MNQEQVDLEIARRKAVIADSIGLNEHISPELRASLDSTLSDESKGHVARLMLLAIQYGRSLERKDWEQAMCKKVEQEFLVSVSSQPQPSELAKKLVNSLGQEIGKDKIEVPKQDSRSIMVVSPLAFDPKTKH